MDIAANAENKTALICIAKVWTERTHTEQCCFQGIFWPVEQGNEGISGHLQMNQIHFQSARLAVQLGFHIQTVDILERKMNTTQKSNLNPGELAWTIIIGPPLLYNNGATFGSSTPHHLSTWRDSIGQNISINI